MLLSRAVGAPGARATHARAGARVGAQGRRATDGRQWRPRCRRRRRRLRLSDALSVQRRAHAGAAADRATSRRRRRSSRWATAPRSRPTTTSTCAWSANDMPPIVRASWFRGVSALPNTFAHESYIDELAARSRRRSDRIPPALPRATTRAARSRATRWPSAPAGKNAPGTPAAAKPTATSLRGRGFAYARYVHSKFPGYGAAWSAWMAGRRGQQGDRRRQRDARGRRAQDTGLMINPDGVRHQIHGNVIQSTSRALMEEVRSTRTR